MGVQNQCDWGTGFLRMMITAFQPAVWAGEHHLWHGKKKPVSCLNPAKKNRQVRLTCPPLSGPI